MLAYLLITTNIITRMALFTAMSKLLTSSFLIGGMSNYPTVNGPLISRRLFVVGASSLTVTGMVLPYIVSYVTITRNPDYVYYFYMVDGIKICHAIAIVSLLSGVSLFTGRIATATFLSRMQHSSDFMKHF